MHCPKCRAEYREGISRCAECDIPLVDALPPRKEDEGDLVAVFKTANPGLLPVIESALNAAGISYVVQGEEGFGVLPVGGRLGGVIIRVPRSRETEAREVLQSYAHPERSGDS